MAHPVARNVHARLSLSRDLATRGCHLLGRSTLDADAVHGVVLVDLALDAAMRLAIDVLRLSRKGDRFGDYLDAISELGTRRADLEQLHSTRNAAQHRGSVPPPDVRPWLARTAVDGLRVCFGLVGSDYDRFSSVPLISSEHFRDGLALAVAGARRNPSQSAALCARVLRRALGWAAEVTGRAIVPDQMWVFGDVPLWNDVTVAVDLADGHDKALGVGLRLAAAAALGMSAADHARISCLCSGHLAQFNEGGWTYEHERGAPDVDPDSILWAIETVARCVLRLEQDWPDWVLVKKVQPSSSTERLAESESADRSREDGCT